MGRAWQLSSDTATTPPGGTYLSALGVAHDADSVVDLTWQSGPGQVTFTVRIEDIASGGARTLTTFSEPLALPGGSACVYERAG